VGKRKITILDAAVNGLAEIAYFIDGKGMPQTAKKFVDEAFEFFQQLSDERIVHRPCRYAPWYELTYRCVTFRKKYSVAYLVHSNEIVICEFVLTKLLV
jgi:plasmid stabilization system protein ParE